MLYKFDASLTLSCIKSVDFVTLHRVCENETWCNLIFICRNNLHRKLEGKKSWRSTCIMPVDNLQQSTDTIKPEKAM